MKASKNKLISILKLKKVKRLTISQKLWISFLGVGTLFFITVSIFYYYLNQMDRSYSDLINKRMRISKNVDNIQIQAVRQIDNLRAFVLTGDQDYISKMKEANQKLTDFLEETKSLVTNPEEQNHIQKLESLNQIFFNTSNDTIHYAQSYLNDNTQIRLVKSISNTSKQFAEAIQEEANRLGKIEQQLIDQESQENQNVTLHSFAMILPVCIITLLLILFIGWMISKMILKPILTISQAAQQIATGDLTIEKLTIQNQDEVGELAHSFNEMAGNLRRLLNQVKESAEHVAVSAEELTVSADQTSKASEEISNVTQEVAVGAEQQFQKVHEGSTAITEMYVGVLEIAENLQFASSSSIHTLEVAHKGTLSLESVTEKMNEISREMNSLSEVIQNLGDQSQTIERIIQVITEIASQTNLLALNAAIEAARAGEHGRAFAIVAEEVRKLADQSSLSAQEISLLISNIQTGTGKAVQFMDLVNQDVVEGLNVVHMAGESFKKIETSIQDVANQIQEVTKKAKKISSQKEVVAHAINEITYIAESTLSGSRNVSAATEQQLAAMQEINSSSYSLSDRAEELQMLVGKFKIF